MQKSQFAYKAIRKQASFAEPSAVNLRPSAGAVGIAKMLVVVLGLSPAASFIAEWADAVVNVPRTLKPDVAHELVGECGFESASPGPETPSR
jgi:hypothetical protein